MEKRPKLRTVEKYNPPYPLGKFPADFATALGREIVYLLASRGGQGRLEGADWEEIFARIVGAKWQPSNVGLDDVVLEQTAWGAKTVKSANPHTAPRVRLISGRNSVAYSYGTDRIREADPNALGRQVLEIWNERVAAVRSKYKHVRTVVLVKSNDLLKPAVFEFDTVLHPPDQYYWQWNRRGNLEGFAGADGTHVFTWQPHGSQFTIIENVPAARLALEIKKPPPLNREKLLASLNFDSSWVKVVK